MSARTVAGQTALNDGDCAACDADKQTFSRGQAYVAGLVLAVVNGHNYVIFEQNNFCKTHREQFERYRKALEHKHATERS